MGIAAWTSPAKQWQITPGLGYCLRLSLDISLGWITLCFSGFSSPVTVVRESPWFSERELGWQAGCWQCVGGVFESHVPLEQRLCAPVSPAPALICSLEVCSIPEGSRKPPEHVAGGEELGKGWWLWMQVSCGREEWLPSEAAGTAVSVLFPFPKTHPTLPTFLPLSKILPLCRLFLYAFQSLLFFTWPPLLPSSLIPLLSVPSSLFPSHASEAGQS